MLHALRLVPILLLAIPFRGLPTRAQVPAEAAVAALLQEKLDSCRTVFNVPGISATMLLPGDRFWNGASGVAHIGTQEPLDTFHVFQAASTTKLFTATIAFQLIEEGLMQLDDTIGAFLPPMANIPGNTRIRYLLNHRSGLADYLGTPGATNNWFFTPDLVWTPQLILQQYSAPPLFAQGAAFSYSNTNYLLLGLVIEAITGNAFHEELQTRLFQPLGLDLASFPPALPIQGELVPGWSSWTSPGVYDTDVTPVLRDCFSSFGYSAGAIVARPWDLARFARAAMSGTLLTPASLSTMRTCTNVSFGDGCNGYGHGTMRYTFAGRSYFGHSGDISGFTQMSIHGMQDSITLTLSINRNNAPRGPIAAALLATVHQALSAGMGDAEHQPPDFSVYPVPARDHVVLRTNELSTAHRIDVLDTAGQIVLTERAQNRGEQVIALQHLAPGVYLVRVSGPDGIRARRMFKE